jgi:hypothetical protein
MYIGTSDCKPTPIFPQNPGFFPAQTSVCPKNFWTIAAKSGKISGFSFGSDGVHAPVHIPARPIVPGTHALKFFPRTFFLFES